MGTLEEGTVSSQGSQPTWCKSRKEGTCGKQRLERKAYCYATALRDSVHGSGGNNAPQHIRRSDGEEQGRFRTRPAGEDGRVLPVHNASAPFAYASLPGGSAQRDRAALLPRGRAL